jgi:hypothetical protein
MEIVQSALARLAATAAGVAAAAASTGHHLRFPPSGITAEELRRRQRIPAEAIVLDWYRLPPGQPQPAPATSPAMTAAAAPSAGTVSLVLYLPPPARATFHDHTRGPLDLGIGTWVDEQGRPYLQLALHRPTGPSQQPAAPWDWDTPGVVRVMLGLIADADILAALLRADAVLFEDVDQHAAQRPGDVIVDEVFPIGDQRAALADLIMHALDPPGR